MNLRFALFRLLLALLPQQRELHLLTFALLLILLFEQRELRLLTLFLLLGGDFRELELQRGDGRRIRIELVASLFGILRLGDLRHGLGDGSCDRTSFVTRDSFENLRQNGPCKPNERIHGSNSRHQRRYDLW